MAGDVGTPVAMCYTVIAQPVSQELWCYTIDEIMLWKRDRVVLLRLSGIGE